MSSLAERLTAFRNQQKLQEHAPLVRDAVTDDEPVTEKTDGRRGPRTKKYGEVRTKSKTVKLSERGSTKVLVTMSPAELLTAFRKMKRNSQFYYAFWALNEQPPEIDNEHFIITENLATYRMAFMALNAEERAEVQDGIQAEIRTGEVAGYTIQGLQNANN